MRTTSTETVTVIRARGFSAWLLATIGARLPIAMAPLALVVVAEQATGSYGFGGALVAAHTVGEIAGSPPMGRLADLWPSRWNLAAVLVLQGAGFAALSWSLTMEHPQWLPVVLAVAVGVIAAGVPGALRSRLTQMVPAPAVIKALSIDSAINQICWAVAPVVVALLAVTAFSSIALLIVAVSPLLAVLACIALPESGSAPETAAGGFVSLARLLRTTLVLTIVLRLALGILAVAAIPVFTDADHAGLAGLALGLYAAATGTGAVTLGARRPLHRDAQRDVALLLALLAAVLIPTLLLAYSVVGLLVVFVLAGFVEGPTVVALSVHIQDSVPVPWRATGFSVQYAALGVGFALGSLALGPLLDVTSPAGAVSAVGAVMFVSACTVALLRGREITRSQRNTFPASTHSE
ncbi:MFS transporter [Rhodococcus sp. H29-C3]|uniref:MFS transporter n=1 Tax=Rhodococcus sp. H29-C3 TaxID=3046307 RepID=UPI0024BA1810|nr:MFS transporter [Rhodococcus sp. H29-C3]MDJ0362544.1 MFS transporter [Rhodococcus sp. H29-C3]